MPGGDLSVRLGRPKDAGTTSPSTPNDHHTNEYRNMSNVSMQTGEEFSPEFLRDCVSRRTPFTDDANQTNRGPTGRGYVNTKKSGNLDSSFSGKIKFLCSFGGSILPRPNDSKLRYVGGDTRIISIRKDISYNDLVEKTMGVCNYHHTIKYQIPGEDLDALISVSSDEDLHHMIEEYHELERKSQRLRIFLVSCCELEDQKQKGDVEYQYVVAVNGLGPQRSSSRESLESLTMQKEPSSLNLKCMLSSPGQVGYVVQPMLAPDFRKPSNEFQPPSMYIPSEKLVPSQDMFCFPHASDLGAKDKGGFGLGKTAENTFFPFANEKYQKPSYKDQLFQEPPNVDRDYVEWGKDASRRKGKEVSSEQDWKNGAINNDYAEFLEQKMKFPNIICQPNEPNFVMKSQKAESILNLPEDEYSLGLYSSVFLDTTTNEELGGDSDGNVKIGKMDRKLYEELSIENDVFTDSSSSEKHVTDEHSYEAGSVAYASEDDDDKGDDDNKNEPINSAAVIEMEASRHGFQIIKNSDLEELQELGSGTFGTVYHGKWRGTDVAIKRIKNSCFLGGASEQEKLTKDFWREAKILSKIHHPNIVAFYGVTPDGPGSTLATVSEYMVNGSLRRVLFKGRALDRRKKVIIALDASFGMEYLHLKNIVHFDLKCDNLLVNLVDSQRPVCKVTDFGLSRIKQHTLVSGGVRGTLPWMAPELLDGDSSRVSEKVDVFSFGIAMWEIFTGEEPYVDMHCGAIIGGIVNNTLRPLVPERCDPEWRKLMEECWSHDPAGRPSFSEITKRLQAMSTSLQPKRYTYRVKR